MAEREYTAEEVFGISREIPLNYQVRPSADDILLESLTRDKHLVVYGSSKQGKTCLRKHCLTEDDSIVVHCSNKWNLADIHSAILKRAGFEVTQSTTKSSSGSNKILAKATLGWLGSKAEAGAEAEREKREDVTTTPLELDPEDVNDVIRALEQIKFERFIVLEDFHYLPVDTQRDFSVSLKAFHENSSLCFLIIGVWLEENRLTVYNGDLTGRVLSINADKWSPDELREVIAAGEALLNIQFTPPFKDDLLAACYESVFIVQEACYQCCRAAECFKTGDTQRTIGDDQNAKEIVQAVVDQHTGRFNSFLTQFADGFQATELEMYRWLLYPVITGDVAELEKGLRLSEIRKCLNDHHPNGESLNPGNITQALQSTSALQIKKEIKPIVLDYDQTNLRLNVVDRSFLIWLQNQDRASLLDVAGLPKN